jgi:hypothetical protein
MRTPGIEFQVQWVFSPVMPGYSLAPCLVSGEVLQGTKDDEPDMEVLGNKREKTRPLLSLITRLFGGRASSLFCVAAEKVSID